MASISIGKYSKMNLFLVLFVIVSIYVQPTKQQFSFSHSWGKRFDDGSFDYQPGRAYLNHLIRNFGGSSTEVKLIEELICNSVKYRSVEIRKFCQERELFNEDSNNSPSK